jgi:hypothetical protein
MLDKIIFIALNFLNKFICLLKFQFQQTAYFNLHQMIRLLFLKPYLIFSKKNTQLFCPRLCYQSNLKLANSGKLSIQLVLLEQK